MRNKQRTRYTSQISKSPTRTHVVYVVYMMSLFVKTKKKKLFTIHHKTICLVSEFSIY